MKKTTQTGNDIFGEDISKKKKVSSAKKTRANLLDGKTWTRYSISIWSDIRKSKEESDLGHPAMFPAELPKRLIKIFMKDEDQVVLDPFAGVGSTLLAAQQCGKMGIGLEISKEYCDITTKRLTQSELFENKVSDPIIYPHDARLLLDYVKPGTVDLTITSPPYWNILLQKRTADYKDQRDYGDTKADLGKIDDYYCFLSALKEIFSKVLISMRKGAYCCIVVMDLRKKDKFYPYHSDIANFMVDLGFIYDDIIVWDRRHEYNNMRPLGYPFVFRVNKAHEYILIFQKPK